MLGFELVRMPVSMSTVDGNFRRAKDSGFQLLALTLREASGLSFRPRFESGTRVQELASKLIYMIHCIYEFKFEESKC